MQEATGAVNPRTLECTPTMLETTWTQHSSAGYTAIRAREAILCIALLASWQLQTRYVSWEPPYDFQVNNFAVNTRMPAGFHRTQSHQVEIADILPTRASDSITCVIDTSIRGILCSQPAVKCMPSLGWNLSLDCGNPAHWGRTHCQHFGRCVSFCSMHSHQDSRLQQPVVCAGFDPLLFGSRLSAQQEGRCDSYRAQCAASGKRHEG